MGVAAFTTGLDRLDVLAVGNDARLKHRARIGGDLADGVGGCGRIFQQRAEACGTQRYFSGYVRHRIERVGHSWDIPGRPTDTDLGSGEVVW